MQCLDREDIIVAVQHFEPNLIGGAVAFVARCDDADRYRRRVLQAQPCLAFAPTGKVAHLGREHQRTVGCPDRRSAGLGGLLTRIGLRLQRDRLLGPIRQVRVPGEDDAHLSCLARRQIERLRYVIAAIDRHPQPRVCKRGIAGVGYIIGQLIDRATLDLLLCRRGNAHPRQPNSAPDTLDIVVIHRDYAVAPLLATVAAVGIARSRQ